MPEDWQILIIIPLISFVPLRVASMKGDFRATFAGTWTLNVWLIYHERTECGWKTKTNSFGTAFTRQKWIHSMIVQWSCEFSGFCGCKFRLNLFAWSDFRTRERNWSELFTLKFIQTYIWAFTVSHGGIWRYFRYAFDVVWIDKINALTMSNEQWAMSEYTVKSVLRQTDPINLERMRLCNINNSNSIYHSQK